MQKRQWEFWKKQGAKCNSYPKESWGNKWEYMPKGAETKYTCEYFSGVVGINSWNIYLVSLEKNLQLQQGLKNHLYQKQPRKIEAPIFSFS